MPHLLVWTLPLPAFWASGSATGIAAATERQAARAVTEVKRILREEEVVVVVVVVVGEVMRNECVVVSRKS